MPDSSGFPCQIPTTAPGEAWRDVLMRAADCIEQCGWCVGVACTSAGEVCIRGALNIKVGPNVSSIALAEADRKFCAFVGSDAARWNDMAGRTAAEVCAALRACAQEPADA